MKYELPEPIERDRAADQLNSDDPKLIIDALLRLALNESDWRWVQNWCLLLATNDDPDVRKVIATSLGHLARIHGELDMHLVRPVLERMRLQSETAGYAENALCDISIFVVAEQ